MKIAIATDHHGVEIKEQLIKLLQEEKMEVLDFGTNGIEMVDYPIFAFHVGEAVASNFVDYGILLCGTGIGMSIACNKVKGVRCAKVNTLEEARLSREHNNANVLALSSKLSISEMKEIIHTFLNTSFLEDRHLRRINQIQNYEEHYDD
ncbi:MAG: ribose 5-phosphate isomerase B [Bacilli bacterium]|nr:ribose 5-phosphate isomerase B [Bacilli bacterium]